MARDTSNGSGTVMLAFVVGALAGAAVALLFAPATGEETREYLGRKAKESADRARQAADQSREFYRSQRDTLSSAIDRGREAFHQARERGEQA